MKILSSLYIKPLFFRLMAITVVVFVIGYFVPIYFIIGQFAFATLVGLLLIDVALLFSRGWNISAKRTVPLQCSLGETHVVKIQLTNDNSASFDILVLDEAPVQLQLRNLELKANLSAYESEELSYVFTPSERGNYQFGKINLFISSILKLAQRKLILNAEQVIAVYPSVLMMKQFELRVFSKVSFTAGIKKVRRLGHSNDFEQIRNYVQGDDYRKINWKATSRRNELMINQYEDEKAQQVYCIVDKSRAMQSTFNELTLLDHAINATLVFSNIAIRKSDRLGLITFSDKIGATLQAERSAMQMKKVMEILYKQKTEFAESNYELLFSTVKKTIKGRSLIILFTNFETSYALERRLSVLRKLNRQHLLVVVFFEDTELKTVDELPTKSLRDVYFNTIAGKLSIEKQAMILELRKYGIQSILTTPDN
jgi:uncharacterized protein (DUF58 family)